MAQWKNKHFLYVEGELTIQLGKVTKVYARTSSKGAQTGLQRRSQVSHQILKRRSSFGRREVQRFIDVKPACYCHARKRTTCLVVSRHQLALTIMDLLLNNILIY